MVVNLEIEEIDNMTHINQSEQKRLQSLKEKKEQFRLKEQQIRLALNNLDKQPSNRKIVFDEDFGDNINNETSSGTKRKRRALFENNDEEEEDSDFVIDVNKSIKDKSLQQTLGNDKRFTLDSRFLQDEQEEIHCENDTEMPEEDFSDLQKEKEWQLSILGNVLGAPVAGKEKKDPKLLKKAKMIRYDPTAVNHEEYEVNNKKSEQTAKDKKKKKNREINAAHEASEIESVPVSKDTFYSVSDTLKESLTQGGGFSLLKTYGKEEGHDNENVTDQPSENKMPEEKQKFKLNFDSSNPFKYDSTDDENEEETLEVNNDPKETEEVYCPRTNDNFFFSEKDIRFNEAVQFFQDVPTTDGDFKDLRRELKQIVRAKIRNNTKKNTSKRVKNMKSNKIRKFKKRQ